MTNKKVIVIVLVFLIGGLLVYSFAATPSKPLEENKPNSGLTDDDSSKDKENEDKEKQEQEELENLKKELTNLKKELEEARESGKYTDESLAEKEKLINIAENATTKEELEKALNDIKNNELIEKEDNSNNTTVTTPIKNPASTNNQTTKPSGSSNQGTTVTPSTPSTSNQGSTSNNNQGTNSGNQGTTNKPATIDKKEITNLQNELNSAKNSGKYTASSIAKKQELIDIANSKTTQSDYDKALEDAKNCKLVEIVGTAIVNVTATSPNSSDKINITSRQEGTNIILGGNIEVNGDAENGKYYISVKVTAPKILDEEILKNAKFKVMDNFYGISPIEKSAYDRILNIQNAVTERAYIVLPSFFIREDKIIHASTPLKIAVDWGDGEYIIYNIHFNDITIEHK